MEASLQVVRKMEWDVDGMVGVGCQSLFGSSMVPCIIARPLEDIHNFPEPNKQSSKSEKLVHGWSSSQKLSM